MIKPTLTIVVIFHNMTREAERTLFSLSQAYQTNISSDAYEIIAIDNGSSRALNPDEVCNIASNISYHFYETNSVSPAAAVNFGVQKARGDFIAVIVDGARMASPGLLSATLKATKSKANPFVCALSWHLGPDVQNKSMLNGYNQVKEDQLLESINWRDDGYRLFENSTIAQSSNVGFGGGMPIECSYLAMPISLFTRIGGFDERFQMPGGGLVNHEFLERCLSISAINPIVILGEGVFHQYHGGVATNVPLKKHPIQSFRKEYKQIFGEYFRPTSPPKPSYVGKMHPAAMKFANDDLSQNHRTDN